MIVKNMASHDNVKPQLTYFNLRGRAEASRLLMIDQGTEFTDHRVTSPGEWQALRKTTAFGALPLYMDTRVRLTQSHAILRYLARLHDLVPAATKDQALYDEAQEALSEAQEDLWRFAWHEAYKTDPAQYVAENLTRHLENLKALFVRNPGEYWVGSAISHIDSLAFVYTDELRAFFPQALQWIEPLAEFHHSFGQRARVRAYIESGHRPVVFGMGLHGPKIDPAAAIRKGEVFENPWTDPITLDRGNEHL